MISLTTKDEKEKYWNNHIFGKVGTALKKKGYTAIYTPKAAFVHDGHMDLVVTKPFPVATDKGAEIKIKFRPEYSKYHYSVETMSGSYKLAKESRRFRYKEQDLKILCDVVEFLYAKLLTEKTVENAEKLKKEEIHKKRLEDAKEIAKALNAKVNANVMYGSFEISFKTFEGKTIGMKFHLGTDGDVTDFEIEGRIKRHHFYSIVDALRKSVSDVPGAGVFVKKRRIDLLSGEVTRVAKNEGIKNLQFSKIRAWKRNFNLEK
jgi:hypothetical protein